MQIEQADRDLIYLTAHALNGISPDAERVQAMNPEQLFRAASFQSMTASCCMAMESAGITPGGKWREAKAKAIRKVLLLTAEGNRICAEMERLGFRYLPLKGMVLSTLYPRLGMRQMSDCDILCDKQAIQKMQPILLQNGYTIEHSENLHHIEYKKAPIYHIELHQTLFQRQHTLCTYYADPWQKCERLPQTKYGYTFTDSDGYIYLTAHAGRHFRSCGTGLRYLADIYIYLQNKKIDEHYVERELQKLHLAEFERNAKALAFRLFAPPFRNAENAEQEELLSVFCRAGAYGTEAIRLEQRLKKMHTGSKASYLWNRLFPDMEYYETYFPFFARHKLLLPIAWSYRLVHGVTVGRKRLGKELNAVKNREEQPKKGNKA